MCPKSLRSGQREMPQTRSDNSAAVEEAVMFWGLEWTVRSEKAEGEEGKRGQHESAGDVALVTLTR